MVPYEKFNAKANECSYIFMAVHAKTLDFSHALVAVNVTEENFSLSHSVIFIVACHLFSFLVGITTEMLAALVQKHSYI